MWPFGKKQNPVQATKLPFKSNQGFFEYCCKQFPDEIQEMASIPAIIVDAQKEFGTPHAVKVEQDGLQTATLRVASPDGGFLTIAKTANPKGEILKAGDLVVWTASEMADLGLGALANDARSDWIGFIVAKIDSEIELPSGRFTVLCRYQ